MTSSLEQFVISVFMPLWWAYTLFNQKVETQKAKSKYSTNEHWLSLPFINSTIYLNHLKHSFTMNSYSLFYLSKHIHLNILFSNHKYQFTFWLLWSLQAEESKNKNKGHSLLDQVNWAAFEWKQRRLANKLG